MNVIHVALYTVAGGELNAEHPGLMQSNYSKVIDQRD